MRKLVLLLALITSLHTFAETDTTRYWSYVERVAHGTTNQVKGIKADTDGNVYYSGYGYEINPGSRHALIVGKMDEQLNYVWKKHFYGYPENQGLHTVLVDENSLYITGTFLRELELPTGTLSTASTSNPETFFICLNTENGEIRWARNLGTKNDVKIYFDGNNDLVLSYATVKGIQTYDGVELANLNNSNYLVRGYGYLTLNNTDGTLKNHSFGVNNILGNTTVSPLYGRKVYSFVAGSASYYDPTYLELRILDLNTNAVTYNKAKKLFGTNKIVGSQYIPKDKTFLLFVQHGNEDITLGEQVIMNPTIPNVFKFTTALKLDSTLKVIDYITYNSVLEYEYSAVNDTTIAFSFGADGDGYIIKNGVMDTVRFKGNVSTYQKGYFIAKSNLNFKNLTFTRFSVEDSNAGWQTGMELKGLDLDANGNVYAAAFHENDIFALPELITAYNKSWKHISVIAKYESEDLVTALTNNNAFKGESISVYPNPVTDVLYVESKETIKSIALYDSKGTVISTQNSIEINVSKFNFGCLFYFGRN